MRGSFIVLVLPCLLAAGEPIPIKAPLTRVRLHPDEAWVTRTSRIRLEIGTHRLRLADLPPGLGLDDLRVSAQGPEGIRIGDLALDAEVRTIKETDAWKAMEIEAETLQDRVDRLGAERNALAQEQVFLKGLQASHDKELSARMSYTPPSAQSVVELSKGLQQRLVDVLARDKQAERELAKLQASLGRLQGEMRKRESEQRQGPSRATVELTLAKAGEINLELSYCSREARWEPNYEARLSADGKRLELALFAAVRQRSGEDWKDVSLEISNVRASRNLDLPRYSGGQTVAWYTYPPQQAGRSKIQGASAQQNTYVSEAAVEVVASGVSVSSGPIERPTYAPQAPVEAAQEMEARKIDDNQGLGVTFRLDGSKDVASDGEPCRFKVHSKDVEHQFVVMCTPRLDPTAYQVARFPTPKGIPLFPNAPIVQFVGTQRLGQTRLLFPEPGKPFQLAFGPHRPMQVRLHRVGLKRETVGLLSKERQWTLEERIESANTGEEAVDLEIYDRALVGGDDKVKVVSLPHSSPASQTHDSVRLWVLRLEPSAKHQLTLGTQIRGPEAGYISGLEGLGLN